MTGTATPAETASLEAAFTQAVEAHCELGAFAKAFAAAFRRRLHAKHGGHALQTQAVLALLSALTTSHARQGHLCLDLNAPELWLPREALSALPPTPGPVAALAGHLHRSGLALRESSDDHTDFGPLILAGSKLYLRRPWEDERAIASAIAVRLAANPARKSDEPERWLADADLGLAQRRAVHGALRHRFSVVTGGPGTGKTSTVVAILAALSRDKISAPHQVRLLAPTGKAASRLREAIEDGEQRFANVRPFRSELALPGQVMTVHRFLADASGAQRLGGGAALATRVAIVDEASMVDATTMARLLRSLPESCSVILVGDHNQLASVEAGSVLQDICSLASDQQHQAPAPEKPPMRSEQLHLFSESAASLSAASGRTKATLASATTVLDQKFRYSERTGIGQLADAILEQNLTKCLALLRDPAVPEVQLDERSPGELPAALKKSIHELATELRAPSAIEDKLIKLRTFGVLCAHRQGPRSVDAIHKHMRSRFKQQESPEVVHGTRFPCFDGLPILIAENDPSTGLSNGDQGIVYRDAGVFRAAFLGGDGSPGYRTWPLETLPNWAPLYAVTVHKSQGSELNTIACLLPAKPSPVLTRELLYTAVTRAKQAVFVYGSPAVIAHALQRRVVRMSGLKELLLRTH